MATISENLQAIIDIKADIKTAIENKGVEVGNVGFDEYAGKIDSISQSGGSSKIDVGSLGLSFAYSTFTEFPKQYFDLSNCISMSNMFAFCEYLTYFYIDQFETSNVNDLTRTFSYCGNLYQIILFDTSNVTNMSNMFEGCYSLTSIPEFNTSNVTDMSYMFMSCSNLTSIPELDTSNVRYMYNMFEACNSLTSIPELNCKSVEALDYAFLIDCYNLETIGGFTNLGMAFIEDGSEHQLHLEWCEKLTYTSFINIFNKVYDMNNLQEFVSSVISVSATQYTLLSDDDIAIATNKGWSVVVA